MVAGGTCRRRLLNIADTEDSLIYNKTYQDFTSSSSSISKLKKFGGGKMVNFKYALKVHIKSTNSHDMFERSHCTISYPYLSHKI